MVTTLVFATMLGLGPPAPPALVTVTTPSGARLAGTYRDAGAGAPGVLFFPMCRPDAMDGWAPVADRLHAAGVSSLAIVYRGYGDSTSAGSGDQRVADADAALAFLQSRIGADASVAIAGSSCGVAMSLMTAASHPAHVRALVALTGPHGPSHVAHVRAAPTLAVLSGASADDQPAPDWARELRAASPHPASRLVLAPGRAHGTDIFREAPAIAAEIADWLAARLREPSPAR